MKNAPKVAVLGAGLAGVSVALELARSGVDVVLVEQDARTMNRAGLRNEGKVHLGLIYALEASLDTARLQLRGALNFRSSLARWIGARADRIPHSTPFVYLVSATSLCCPETLESRYAQLQRAYRSSIESDSTLNYLGRRPESLYRRQAGIDGCFRGARLSGSFETSELAIDTRVLASHLRSAVRESGSIHTRTRHRVRSVTRDGDRLRVEASTDEGSWRQDFEQVVNALWDGRIEIDGTYGLPPEPGWLYRLKYRVVARLPRRLIGAPSVTMVLGRYGDVVIRQDGTVYLSWYPACMKGWSHDRSPPADWAPACRGAIDGPLADRIAEQTLRAIDAWYPGIGDSEPYRVDAGVICAYGATDVDDGASALHNRTRVGLRSDDGYHSLDPGKLTTAPLFGRLAARAVLER